MGAGASTPVKAPRDSGSRSGSGRRIGSRVLSTDLASKDVQGDPTRQGAEYLVSVQPIKHLPNLPRRIILRLAYEALAFVDEETRTPIYMFPYQLILCWGHTPSVFQFKVFGSVFPDCAESQLPVVAYTTQGAEIERNIMTTVVRLMEDTKKQSVTKEQFDGLLQVIFTEYGELDQHWLDTIQQFANGHTFLVKQAIDIFDKMGPELLFERIELACFMYENLVNVDSFQLLLNRFDSVQDRENIVHRLKIDPSTVSVNCDQGLTQTGSALHPEPTDSVENVPPANNEEWSAQDAPFTTPVRRKSGGLQSRSHDAVSPRTEVTAVEGENAPSGSASVESAGSASDLKDPPHTPETR